MERSSSRSSFSEGGAPFSFMFSHKLARLAVRQKLATKPPYARLDNNKHRNHHQAAPGATGRNRTCDVAFGGPHDIHFTTVAVRGRGF